HLRQALGAAAARLQAPTSHTLRLALEEAAIDVLDFDRAIQRGDPASLEEAVRLYRGPLLEGCAEEWIAAERPPPGPAYLQALEQLAAAAREEGQSGKAVALLQRLVGADPLRESAYRELMRALDEAGNFAAAVQVYRDLRRLLLDELRMEPAAE